VGASVVNALSEWTVVEVFREGKHHRIAFSRGEVTEPLKEVGPAPKGKTGHPGHLQARPGDLREPHL
jgi:DNA gyrase subunit B